MRSLKRVPVPTIQNNVQVYKSRGKTMDDFIRQLLSFNPLPQRAEYIHREHITITLQYVPGEGYVVGYQDRRVSHKVNPIMKFADLHYNNVKSSRQTTNSVDRIRDFIMNSPVLSSNSLKTQHIKNDTELNLKLDTRNSASELKQVMIEVCYESEFLYDKNSKTLGERPIFTKLN